MKLKKFLRITKSAKFTIFVYQEGHVKAHRSLDEVPLKTFDVERNERGELPPIEFTESKVTEIIPHIAGVNVVVEIKEEM